jgi:branched-chain amino acid aminotransferase
MSGMAANETTTSSLTSAGIEDKRNASSSLAPLKASSITYSFTKSPKQVPAPDDPAIKASNITSDHMVTCRWTETNGWETPELKPFGPFSIMPTASVLHYATECFEGMKLYRGHDGQLRLFRPDLNCKRFLVSSLRIALPGFDPEEVLKLIVELCAIDGPKWLPKDRPGSFLYIRPTMIATDPALGVHTPREALFYAMLCVFPTMDSNVGGMKLLASRDDMVRAWPGGFGYAKVGANYGPSLLAQGEAKKRNCDQILWLFGEDYKVTEAGASNFFVIWKTKDGKTQLITAPLSDKLILDGVTRRSVLELTKERLAGGVQREQSEGGALEPLEIVERYFTMSEVVEAADEGRLVEAFGAGTAFFVSQVSSVTWKDREIKVPVLDKGYALLIKGWLGGIMYGKERHDWGYVVQEKEAKA